MISGELKQAFLVLVRLGLGHNEAFPFKLIDWKSILSLAFQQGLSAIVLDGINQLPLEQRPSKEVLLEWIGQTIYQSNQYKRQWEVANRLADWWSEQNISATIIKGRSIAKYYPAPEHRYSCDLDVFVEHDWERACKLIEEHGVPLVYEVYKEVEFTLDEVYVECHRYITPVRGNKHLKEFERYLRSLLDNEPKEYFEGTTLVCPPLMFTVMLYIEHALGDLLHGHLTLKHIVDWVVLRKQDFNCDIFIYRCKEFKFDKFLSLIDAFADVVEGKLEYNDLPPLYKKEFDEIFKPPVAKRPHSWFGRRVDMFFDIIKNGKKFHDYGYTSMPSFLFHGVWAHFFDKEVRL